MSCFTVVPEQSVDVWTNSTDARFRAVTGWFLATGLDSIRAVLKNKSVSGSIATKVAYRTAAVRPDNPNAWIAVGAAQNGNGESPVDATIATETDDTMWVQFGIQYANQTGLTVSSATVYLTVSFNACGKLVGGAALDLASDSNTTSRFYIVTGWLPAKTITKVKASIVNGSFTGELRSRLAWRTANTSVQDPDAWTSSDSWLGDGETCTGEIGITETEMWIQFGLACKLNTGTSLATGTCDVQVSIRS